MSDFLISVSFGMSPLLLMLFRFHLIKTLFVSLRPYLPIVKFCVEQIYFSLVTFFFNAIIVLHDNVHR